MRPRTSLALKPVVVSKAGIDVADEALAIGEENGVGNLFDDLREQGAGLLREAAFGHIPEKKDGGSDDAVGIANRAGGDADPVSARALRVLHKKQFVANIFSAKRSGHRKFLRRKKTCLVVKMPSVECHGLGKTGGIHLGGSQYFARGSIVKQGVGIRIGDQNADGQHIEDQTKSLRVQALKGELGRELHAVLSQAVIRGCPRRGNLGRAGKVEKLNESVEASAVVRIAGEDRGTTTFVTRRGAPPEGHGRYAS